MNFEDRNIIEQLKLQLQTTEPTMSFVKKHAITEDQFEQNFFRFIQNHRNFEACKNCNGLNECKSDVYGFSSQLVYQNNRVSLSYFACQYNQEQKKNYIDTSYFPNTMHYLNESELDKTKERSEALKEIIRFLGEYEKEGYAKGIYLHGSFGTGKTFIMMHLAKQVAGLGKQVVIAYYPDLVNKIKASIATRDYEEHILRLKNVDVLILDDVGGESNSSFVRDEILGPILQYRVMSDLPVFMTSNFSFDMMREHLADTRDEFSRVKTGRIIDRMKYAMRVVELKGESYRK